MRLIDANEFKRKLINELNVSGEYTPYECGLDDAIYWLDDAPTIEALIIPESGIGELSDGYHTFNELYHHRAVLFSVICNLSPKNAWKSKLHDTGDMYDGMFIVGINTAEGQATYHYDVDPYWEMFKVQELPRAPKWDGHTPEEAIRRIGTIEAEPVVHGRWEWFEEWNPSTTEHPRECDDCGWRCSRCKTTLEDMVGGYWDNPDEEPKLSFCPNCGAKMDGGT